jgi:hypothetical protein
MVRRLRRWWFYREGSSAFTAMLVVPVLAGLAFGGWLVAKAIASDDTGNIAYYEVTTEKRITVPTGTRKPRVQIIRSVKRVYVDPKTVRSTRVITSQGRVRTVVDAVVRTMPVTTERVVRRNGKPTTITVVRTRTSVLTRTDVRTQTQRETTTQRDTTTTLRTTTIPVTTTREVTETRPVTTTVRTTDMETTTIATTVEVPTTVTVTVTKRRKDD